MITNKNLALALFISTLAFSANLVAAGEKPTLERQKGIKTEDREAKAGDPGEKPELKRRDNPSQSAKS
jgi:hypothetical protein